mmetsp:Transcript_40960/g.94301  ORF Transcript_40960/g.94301 Transcript_40960/m.94301 type:complete len:80 (-) Transcript_40960:6736-6975(-)
MPTPRLTDHKTLYKEPIKMQLAQALLLVPVTILRDMPLQSQFQHAEEFIAAHLQQTEAQQQVLIQLTSLKATNHKDLIT